MRPLNFESAVVRLQLDEGKYKGGNPKRASSSLGFVRLASGGFLLLPPPRSTV